MTAADQLDAHSRELISSAGTPALVVVSGPAALDLGEALRSVLVDTAASHDNTADTTDAAEVSALHLVPTGTRWTVSDVTTQILNRVRFAADGHQHLVVAEAHKFTPGTMDRLLKLLEEPPPGVTLWLTHPIGTNLSTPLLGRAAANLLLHTAPIEDLVGRFHDAHPDLSREDSRQLVRDAGGDLALAAVVAKFHMAPQLMTFAQPRRTSTPTVTAARLTLDLAHLAVALHHKTSRTPAAPLSKKGDAPTADLARLNPEAKATLRRLVAAVFARWERELVTELGDADLAAGRRIIDQIRALRDVSRAAVFSTPVMTMLAAGQVAVAE